MARTAAYAVLSQEKSSEQHENWVVIRDFQLGDEAAFRTLNEAWIAKYFGVEASDREVLDHPVEKILNPGGRIFMAFFDGNPVGCCALIVKERGVFELAKMAVKEQLRGHGIGRRILAHAIAEARGLGARSVYLETNNTLKNAIHLYESQGFRHLPPERIAPSPYARANVFMELLL
jgi:N-acetylglutamate synthase-like GNAT family acetyltransferase